MSSCDLRRPAERALRPDRAAAAPDLHRPRIAVVGERVQLAARRPPEPQDEQRTRRARRPRRRSVMPRSWSFLGRHRPDAPEPLDGERVEKRQLAVGRHHEQAVGLGDAAGHLGEELGSRHADRDRQADLLEHLAPQPHGDLGRRARDPLQPAHVEEGLVDRQPFDQRRRVLEHPEHGLARLGVGRHARRDDDRVAGTGGAPAGRPSRCGRRRPWPRSWPRARHRRRRSRAVRAGEARLAARPTRRTRPGRRAGSSPCSCEHMFA